MSESLPDQSVSLVVCGHCERRLFVDVHPRNSCGCPGRGERVKFIPAPDVDAIVQAVGNRLGPWTESDATALRDALRAEGL